MITELAIMALSALVTAVLALVIGAIVVEQIHRKDPSTSRREMWGDMAAFAWHRWRDS